MAMNPMQKKANSYLLIGVLVTLLITGSIIAILFMQLDKAKKDMNKENAKYEEVAVLSKAIKSGETIKSEDLSQTIKIDKNAIPTNLLKDSDFYTTNKNNKDEEKQEEVTYISKVNQEAGAILTKEMVYKQDEKRTDDIRKQEYNMIVLPSQIETGDFIDVRLQLPDGTDYIVVPKKEVYIPMIGDSPSANTIRIELSEDETLLMSSAIIEAYYINGSKLYATTYSNPGLQKTAAETYLPSENVYNLASLDPNIVEEARSGLQERYGALRDYLRKSINDGKNQNAMNGQANVESKVQEEINRSQQERQAYLDALAGL